VARGSKSVVRLGCVPVSGFQERQAGTSGREGGAVVAVICRAFYAGMAAHHEKGRAVGFQSRPEYTGQVLEGPD